MVAKYRSPGVYIEEVSTGPKPIAGAPTNVGAFVGRARRGPMLTPIRLSSWNDYLDTFGGYLEEDAGYLPESVFGFFENGGGACYIVRADNSQLRSWNVLDAAGDVAFTIEASSPGGWANGLTVNVGRETRAIRGLLYSARLTSDVNLTAGTQRLINVSTTSGVRAGMTVRVADIGGNESECTVDEVLSDRLRVTPDTANAFVAGETAVFALHAADAEELRIRSGRGFVAGDLVAAMLPTGERVYASVEHAANDGTGMVLELDDRFTSDVPGAAFAPRLAEYEARLPSGVASGNVTLTALSWTEADPALTPGDLRPGDDSLILANGVEGAWQSTGGGRFHFDAPVPGGRVRVRARILVRNFTTPVNLVSPAPADLPGAFGYVPDGTSLTLEAGDGTTVEVTRSGSAFTSADDAILGGNTWISATFSPDYTALTSGIVISAARAPEAGDYVDFNGTLVQIASVATPSGIPDHAYVLELTDDLGGDPGGSGYHLVAWQDTVVRALRFSISALLVEDGETVEVESFEDLSLNPEHGRYYFADRSELPNRSSRLIRVTERDPGIGLATSLDALPVGVVEAQAGGDGPVTVGRLQSGFEALEGESEPALVACPDALLFDEIETAAVVESMIGHCEKMRRFAVVDMPAEPDPQALVEWRSEHLDSTYAAAYAPFVRVLNPRSSPRRRVLDVPPSGYVMGVIARTDNQRGVFKAPANERVQSIVGLTTNFTQGQQDLLNPNSVNLIRSFPGRGTRIWGARNLTEDTMWRYVNVRRTFLFVENSIDRGTQWVVFEPNNAATWLRVRVSVENFLNQLWRSGGLQGASPDEAYRVAVGRGVTMTQTDIDLGLLIIEVAIAVVRPAEFVVFRISHKLEE